MSDSLAGLTMFELFRMEAVAQLGALGQGIIAVEKQGSPEALRELMRAAHSLKGAARIVGFDPIVSLAHAVEDVFVSAQKRQLVVDRPMADVLLAITDLLQKVTRLEAEDADRWMTSNADEVSRLLAQLEAVTRESRSSCLTEPSAEPARRDESTLMSTADDGEQGEVNRRMHLDATTLTRLLALAAQAVIEASAIGEATDRFRRLRLMEWDLAEAIDRVRRAIARGAARREVEDAAATLMRDWNSMRERLAAHLENLESLEQRTVSRSARMYEETLNARMVRFGEASAAIHRTVRDLAHRLGKEVEVSVRGERTAVDRDVLQRIELPLNHLLRNAVDHGIESPAERAAAGKPIPARIIVEARHVRGNLQLLVSDDGRGIDIESVRAQVVTRGLATPAVAASLKWDELMRFLFLPGFSTRRDADETSGRGIGLDIVQTIVRRMRGDVTTLSLPGGGITFELQLPVTLSLLRCLVVDIGGEPYAFPLRETSAVVRIDSTEIVSAEGKAHFSHRGRPVALISAHQLLGLRFEATSESVCAVIIGEGEETYALIVDRLLDNCELHVQPLDRRLGHLNGVAAGALLDEVSAVLVLSTEDLLRTIASVANSGQIEDVSRGAQQRRHRSQRILVVDDSLTVRELERKLLVRGGYEVQTAVDGLDGWNTLRQGEYDLVVSDIDMPRLDGIELVRLIRQDQRFQNLPVLIVSYKDRVEDRERGLEAGADRYLTKGAFQDEMLLEAVHDLIGEGT